MLSQLRVIADYHFRSSIIILWAKGNIQVLRPSSKPAFLQARNIMSHSVDKRTNIVGN